VFLISLINKKRLRTYIYSEEQHRRGKRRKGLPHRGPGKRMGVGAGELLVVFGGRRGKKGKFCATLG